MKENQGQQWGWYPLSKNKCITWDIVQANPDEQWDWCGLSENPNITWDIIQANPKMPWEFEELSTNPNITWEIVKANPKKRWCPGFLSENPNITWEIIKTNPKKNLCWRSLSLHPNITWDIVKANPKMPWDWFGLCQNPNISWENLQDSIMKNDIPDLADCSFALSQKTCLTWDIVQANPQVPWSWHGLSKNEHIFQFADHQIEHCAQCFSAARIIQRAYREVRDNPKCKFCQKRLLGEFSEMIKDNHI